jgi:hypothetical protein
MLSTSNDLARNQARSPRLNAEDTEQRGPFSGGATVQHGLGVDNFDARV